MLLSSINIGLPTKLFEDSSFIHSRNKDDLKLQTLVVWVVLSLKIARDVTISYNTEDFFFTFLYVLILYHV